MNAISHIGKSPCTRIRLGPNRAASVPGGRGTSIRCVGGLVWVTQEGDARDYIVPRGLSFVASTAGRIVVTGMAGDNAVEIGIAGAAGTSAVAYQPLQIDWDHFARIEHEARRARAEYLAAAACAAFTAMRRAWRRVRRRLVGAMSVAAIHKSGGRA